MTRTLTVRQQQVLMLMADGLTQEEIAGNLFISRSTVENHTNEIIGRLGARNSANAIAIAFRLKLLE